MTSSAPGPTIRTVAAAWDWFRFEARQVLAAPLDIARERHWGLAALLVLLWPVLLPGVGLVFVGHLVRVLRHRDSRDVGEQMWERFADGVTDRIFRVPPDGGAWDSKPRAR
jgi:hypothetical protein